MPVTNLFNIDTSKREYQEAVQDLDGLEALLENLVRARKDSGLTHQQVADVQKTSVEQITEFEHVFGNPNAMRMLEYARAVGMRLTFHIEPSGPAK